jgi:hypothetical protein
MQAQPPAIILAPHPLAMPDPDDVIGALVAALREASAALDAELPDELSLAILLRWGGMQHQTATMLLNDPRLGLRLPREWSDFYLQCRCGLVLGSQETLCDLRHYLRHHLTTHETFRPTRVMAAHMHRITVNSEGGYRDQNDATLDEYRQAWCYDHCRALRELQKTVWHNARNLRPGSTVFPHEREFSLVEFLKRAPTGRLAQDYYGLTGRSRPGPAPSCDHPACPQALNYRAALIRGILDATPAIGKVA